MWLYTLCNINVFILHINYIIYVHYLYILVSHLVVWQPTHGTRRHERPPDSYINNLERDIGLREINLQADIMNRDVWKSIKWMSGTVMESIKRIPKYASKQYKVYILN